jgi:hypothetical protein
VRSLRYEQMILPGRATRYGRAIPLQTGHLRTNGRSARFGTHRQAVAVNDLERAYGSADSDLAMLRPFAEKSL